MSQLSALEQDRTDNERMKCLFAFVLSENDNCIDVGAHEGTVLREILRCAPLGRHLAYEPIPRFHDILIKNFSQVEVRRAALSTETGYRSFKYVTSNPGYSGFRERSYPGPEVIEDIQVRLERLDDSLPSGYVPALIKVDVEGAEREVFQGAMNTIIRHRPTIIFEHGRGAADRYDTRPEHMYELLCQQAKLRIFDLDGNGPYSLNQLVDTFEAGTRWNWVAHK